MITITAHGRIGRDAELRHTSDGTAVCDIAIGCNYGRKGADGKKPTQWIRASLWGKQAEALAQYLVKGKGVIVVLEDAHVREFQSSNGTGHSLEGRVIGIEFTGAGSSEEQRPAQQPQRSAAPARAPQRQAPAQRPAGGTAFDDMDSDIPF